MAKILIIEDDQYIAEELRVFLLREKHTVDLSATGSDGLYRLQHFDYDLAIVDWILPDVQGVDICRKIHSIKENLPMLMLTSRADISDRIEGLDSGALDYIVKPCDLLELSARIRSLLRRVPEKSDTMLSFVDLFVSPESRTVKCSDVPIVFSAAEYDILHALLLCQSGMDHKAIARAIGKEQDQDLRNSLKTLILRIRRKLSAAGSQVSIAYSQENGYQLKAGVQNHESD